MSQESFQLSSSARWYALHVRHRYEATAAAVLGNKGFETFLPLHRVRRRWSDRIAEVELPLFPGYVFCRVDLNDRRVPIMTTPGVIQIVGLVRTPCPVDDNELAAVRRVIASGLTAEPCRYLPIGATVRIEAGALAGLEGAIVEFKNKRRLFISVSLLQRSVAVEIDPALITPVRRPAPPLRIAYA